MKIFNIHMYILYENGERNILIKTLIPKMHLNMALLVCVYQRNWVIVDA